MSIPKHDDIRLPALELLSKHDKLKLKEFEKPLADIFKLTEEEVSQRYENTSNKAIFYDRIAWALSYMNMSDLVTKPQRGVYKITDMGRKMLVTPKKLNSYIDEMMGKRKQSTLEVKDTIAEEKSNLTPQEELYESYEKIRESTYSDIIDTILSKSPREFENLVVILLQKMGYGGEVKSSGIVTNYTNDGGIDGIIKEDVLGLGRIHIQAKRYARENKISRDEIQKFVGALAVAQSNKGVFITTSSFKKTATEYVAGLNGSTNVVLIDGQQLAHYIYEYGLGMQVEQTIEIKKLDSDFWDALENETDS